MTYVWADGYHAPKGLRPDKVAAAIDNLSDPSPEAMLEATKSKRHVLHEVVWGEGDQAWAQRGRLDFCRKIMGAIKEVIVHGGKSIEVRTVEFVRQNGDGRWYHTRDIRGDAELLDAYMAEIVRLQDQAAGKMAKLRALMRPED